MEENRNTSRGKFLRQVATTLGVALGAVAFPALASAIVGKCCTDSTDEHGCKGPCTGTMGYLHCDCRGIGESYCLTSSGCHQQGYCERAAC